MQTHVLAFYFLHLRQSPDEAPVFLLSLYIPQQWDQLNVPSLIVKQDCLNLPLVFYLSE